MKATIYQINEDGSEKVLATYTLKNGVAIGEWDEGTDAFKEQVEYSGIYGPKGQMYFPSHGEKFIKALESNFANSSRVDARIT